MVASRFNWDRLLQVFKTRNIQYTQQVEQRVHSQACGEISICCIAENQNESVLRYANRCFDMQIGAPICKSVLRYANRCSFMQIGAPICVRASGVTSFFVWASSYAIWTFPLLLVQMGYGLLCGLWVWRRRTNRRPCRPPLSNPSTPHGLHGLTVLDDETTEWLLNTCPDI